ncbi:MAG: sporulation transcriptional regulator SpoIIID [Eubacteriales bacterium]
MKDYIEQRVLKIANYVLETKATVRQAASVFKISKSTVHKDMSERLFEINPQLARSIKDILKTNKEERHLRGGIATHNKYKKCL